MSEELGMRLEELESDSSLPLREGRVRAKPSYGNGAAVFWFLILTGVITFAPCILLPEWRSYQAANAAQQREEHRVSKLKAVVDRERRQLNSIQNDPTVVARLAQRDLGFHRPGDTVVTVPVDEADSFAGLTDIDGNELFIPAPVPPPVWFSRATWWLPDLNYDAIFCDSSTRPIVMLMSMSVIVVAVVLFQRRSVLQ